jgi:hypothetical protein
MFYAFQDTHVDGQRTGRLCDKPEESYRLRKEIPERLLVDKLSQRWVSEYRREGQ